MNSKIEFLVKENIKVVKNYLKGLDIDNNYSENVDYQKLQDVFGNTKMKDTSVSKVNTDLLYLFTFRKDNNVVNNGLCTTINKVQEGIGLNVFTTNYYNTKLFKKGKQGYFNKYDYEIVKELESILREKTLADAYFNADVSKLFNSFESELVKSEIMFLISMLDVYYYEVKEMQMHPFKYNKYINKIETLKKMIYASIDSIKEEINCKKLTKEIF